LLFIETDSLHNKQVSKTLVQSLRLSSFTQLGCAGASGFILHIASIPSARYYDTSTLDPFFSLGHTTSSDIAMTSTPPSHILVSTTAPIVDADTPSPTSSTTDSLFGSAAESVSSMDDVSPGDTNPLSRWQGDFKHRPIALVGSGLGTRLAESSTSLSSETSFSDLVTPNLRDIAAFPDTTGPLSDYSPSSAGSRGEKTPRGENPPVWRLQGLQGLNKPLLADENRGGPTNEADSNGDTANSLRQSNLQRTGSWRKKYAR
jgi:hypothetical protein